MGMVYKKEDRLEKLFEEFASLLVMTKRKTMMKRIRKTKKVVSPRTYYFF